MVCKTIQVASVQLNKTNIIPQLLFYYRKIRSIKMVTVEYINYWFTFKQPKLISIQTPKRIGLFLTREKPSLKCSGIFFKNNVKLKLKLQKKAFEAKDSSFQIKTSEYLGNVTQYLVTFSTGSFQDSVLEQLFPENILIP